MRTEVFEGLGFAGGNPIQDDRTVAQSARQWRCCYLVGASGYVPRIENEHLYTFQAYFF